MVFKTKYEYSIMIKYLILLVPGIFIGINLFGQDEIKADDLKEHVYFLASDSLEGRGLATESGRKAAAYVADQFKKSGLKKIGDSYFHPFHARIGQTMLEGRNVVGLVEGSDPELKNEYILIGAHYDHVSYRFTDGEKIVYNGADDNASGTSAIIELGRFLQKNRKSLKRSVILVAFDAEESGLIGSGELVKQNIVDNDQIKLMFSIDMIGRYQESNYIILGALDGLKDAVKTVRPLAEKYDLKIKRTGGEVSNRTDTKPFGDAGIPAVYVTTGIVGPYHKPEDDRETLDYEGMERISKLMADYTTILANEATLEPANRLVSESKTKGLPLIRFGFKSGLGGSSNVYPDEFYKGKSRFSTEEGFLLQLKITNNIALQPELMYSMMGSRHEEGKLRLHSVTTPISIIIASKMQQMARQRFFASFGGYYSYHFEGTLDKQSLDFESRFNQTEYGITYGFGLEVMSVFAGVNFKHGLSNLLLDDNSGKIKNRGVYFTIGYFF